MAGVCAGLADDERIFVRRLTCSSLVDGVDAVLSEPLISRRSFLGRHVNGAATLALTSLLQDSLANEETTPSIAARPGHHPARAKRVIFLWMSGGPSQIDTFDPKPDINRLATERRDVTEAPFKFSRHGQSGMWISELLPHIARHADDLCVIRSMKGDTSVHEHAQTFVFTGVPQHGSPVPTIGNWVVWGLGSESDNLPAYVSIGESNPKVSENFFLPAWTQGSQLNHGGRRARGQDQLISNLGNRWLSPDQQRRQLDFLQRMNASHAQTRTADDRLNARIETFERAFRMQVQAPDAFDFTQESEATQTMYGIGRPETDEYAQRCIIARRLAERGVRFIVVPFSPAPESQPIARLYGWDSHEQNNVLTPILHLLGLDHERLSYQASGRRHRLTDVYGNVVHGVIR